MTEWLLVLAGVAMVVACGGFVAAEFSFVTVDRPSVERAAAAGDKRSAGTLRALSTLSTQLSGAQLGITVTNLTIGFLAEPAIAALVDGPLESAGVSPDAVGGVSITIALVLATAMTMVFGELVPKNLAIARPLQTARWVQGFQRGFTRAALWPIRFLNGTSNRVLRLFGIEPSEELASARSPEELASLVARSAQQGVLEQGTAALVQRSLAFGDRRVRDVLTPAPQLVDVAADDAVSRVVELATTTGYSRFPVTDPTAAAGVSGVVHVRRAVAVPYEQRGTTAVRDVQTGAVVVPESMELDTLLEQLRSGGHHLAVVVDEFGGLAGVVTIEDLVEEIVGEVHDEHDEPAPSVRQDGPGSWVVSGLLRPDEASGVVGAVLPESEEYDSLGGMVTVLLGRLAVTGDEVRVTAEPPEHEPWSDDDPPRPSTWTLTVLGLDGHRVDELRLARVDDAGDAGDREGTGREEAR